MPANTGSFGEVIGYYFASDADDAVTVDGSVDTNVYRKITTGDINAAFAVPEPATAAEKLADLAALAGRPRRRQAVAAVG